MLVVVDALAHVIGFTIELVLVLLGQMAVVLRHVFLFVVLKPLLAALQALGFPRRELTALYPVCNAILLARLTPVDLVDAWMCGINLAGPGASVVGLLRSSGSDEHQATRRKNYERLRDLIGHVSVEPPRRSLVFLSSCIRVTKGHFPNHAK